MIVAQPPYRLGDVIDALALYQAWNGKLPPLSWDLGWKANPDSDIYRVVDFHASHSEKHGYIRDDEGFACDVCASRSRFWSTRDMITNLAST